MKGMERGCNIKVYNKKKNDALLREWELFPLSRK